MLHSYIEQFLHYCQVSNFSAKSIEAFTTRLRQFNRHCESLSLTSIHDINYAHLLTFIAEFGSPSPHVKKNRVWAVRQFYHFLKLNKIVEDNIAIKLPVPKIEKKVPHVLTVAEFNRILDYFAHQANSVTGLRNLIIIMLFGFPGLRLQAVLKLNVENVDLQSRIIWIQEKGGVQRNLPLPDILVKALAAYMQAFGYERGPLFLSKRKKRLSQSIIHDIFCRAMDELTIKKKLHAHLFRHTAATHINKVAGPDITKHVLGHACQQHTRRYCHLNPDIYAEYMTKHPYMEV